MRYVRPEKVEDALSHLAAGTWQVLAGGTDYYPGLRDAAPSGQILDITAIEDLRRIEQADGYWSIGATATWSDVIAAGLPPAFDALKSAAREVGSVQIQNRATVAGNICNASPAADGVPPLLTLDAIVELKSPGGERRIALSDFLQGNRATVLKPDEIVTRILIPDGSSKGVSAFLKLGARKYLVISISMVAVRLECDAGGAISKAAIAVGACSAVAQRLDALEKSLAGAKVADLADTEVTAEHLGSLSPIDDVRSTAGYRLDASAELVRRAISKAAEGFGR